MKPTRYIWGREFQQIGGIMLKMHYEIVRELRWDLTPESRQSTLICLN